MRYNQQMELMSVLARDYGLQVISGGQIGADLAGLRVAQSLGLRTGGTAPKGYRTLKGPQPGLAGFGVGESTRTGYPTRTQRNVHDGDATIIVAKNLESAGTKLTIDYCKQASRACYILHVNMQPQGFNLVKPDALTQAVSSISKLMQAKLLARPAEPFVLNIAGNSSDSAPRIFIATFILLVQLFNGLEKQLSNNDSVSEEFYKRASFLQQLNIPLQLEDVFDYVPQLDPRRASLLLEE